MGPGIIEAFILNWLCPFSVCNEQDHIPWQCQPVQIRRKSSFLFCLNQSPKFQSNSNRVSLGLGEVEQDDVSATITEKMKTWPCCSEDLLTFPCEMPRCPATFSCLKISDHWKPICCNSLVGHGTNTHTHTHFDQMEETFQFHQCFRGQGHLMFPIHVCENEIPVPYVTQTTDSRCPGNGKVWEMLVYISNNRRMNNELLFLLIESCRSLKLTANHWQRVQIEE